MSKSAGGVADLILKRTEKKDLGKITLNGEMFNVLVSIDGQRTLSQIAVQNDLTLLELRPIIIELAKLKLITKVEKNVPVVDQDFINFTISALAVAIGPLGEIVLEEGLEDLGYSTHNFPQEKCAELVNLLAQDIQRENQRIEFKKKMLKIIRKRGY